MPARALATMTDDTLVPHASHDEALVDACRAGQAAALRRLYETHQAAVRRMVQLVASEGVAVEDLVQDTFVRALERLDTYRGDAPLPVWLRGIALNLTRTERDRRRRRKRLRQAQPQPTPMSRPSPRVGSRSID